MATASQPISYESPLNTLITLLGNKNVFTDTNTAQQTQQLLNQLLSTTTQGTQGTQSSGTTTNTADLGALRQAFQTAQAGMTPEALQALITSVFTEGSAKVPEIIGAYANATGSRATGNSASRLALDELNKNLSTQAVQALLQFNQGSQQTAANAASQIAANTRETQQTQQQQQQTAQTQQQQTNQTQTGTTNSQQTANQANTVKPNYTNLAIAGGGALLNNLLKNPNIARALGMGGAGGADAAGGLTMGAGGSPLSFGGTGAPGGITSLSSPTFASSSPTLATSSLAGPTGLNNNFTGLGAAPTQQQLVQSFMPTQVAAPVAGLGSSLAGGASTLGNAGQGVAGFGSPTQIGTFDGSGLMSAGSGINFGGIGAGNVDFLGAGADLGLGATGGAASTLAGSNPWGISTAGSGGITDIMAGQTGGSTLGFSDYLSQAGSGIGSFFGGIGDALGGAADWLGSFFADGGQVGRRRPVPGYADGGPVGGMGYRPAGNDIFQESLNRRLMEAGLLSPVPVQMQQGTTPRIAGTADLPPVTPGAVAGLLPFLLQQLLVPQSMQQLGQPRRGFADGGAIGGIAAPGTVEPFGMADGGTTSPGVIRNRPNMGTIPVRPQTGAINFAGYDNPALAQFVNAGGSAANYIDPAAQAAELAARAQTEAAARAEAQQLAQASGGQQFQAAAGPVAGAAGTNFDAAAQREAGVNAALAAIARGNPITAQAGTPDWQLQMGMQLNQLNNLAQTSQDPEVANYYRYLASNVQQQVAGATPSAVAGSSGVGEGIATGPTSVSQGQAGLSGGVSPGIGVGASAIGSVVGAPLGLAISAINAIGQAVGEANAPGGVTASGPGIGEGVGSVGSEGGIGSVGEGIGVGSGSAGIGGIGDAATSGVGVGVGADAGPSSVGDGGGGGGGSKIICTAMNQLYGLPPVRNRTWVRYSRLRLAPEHERGYHKLFLPLVHFGFKSGDSPAKLAVRRALEWIAVNRTQVLEDRLAGKVTNRWHHLLCGAGEKLCYAVGKVTS